MSISLQGWLKLAAILLALYALSQAMPIFLPLLIATMATFILHPVVRFFSNLRIWPVKRKMPQEMAIVAAFLFAAIILTLIVTFIFMPFVKEFNRFIANLPQMAVKVRSLTEAIGAKAQTVILPESLQVMFDTGLSNGVRYSVEIVRRLANAILGLAGQIIELIVVPVLTYYFLKDWPSLKTSFIAVFPAAARQKAQTIIEEMAVVVSGYIRGQVLVSVIMGGLVFAGMLGLGVDYPLVLGLIATLTEAIPIIGPIIGAVPALFLAYLDSPVLALQVLAFYLIVHQVENHIIVPGIMRRTVALHPVAVIISLLIGGHLLGIVGMILAVPVAALLRVLYIHLWHYES